jgi:ABC-type Fe3+ transport system permease subunit
VKRHGALSLLASWRDGLFRRQPRDRVLDLVLENAAARYANETPDAVFYTVSYATVTGVVLLVLGFAVIWASR